MIQFLIIWVSSFIFSIGADVSLSLKMIKDVADSGYKLKYDKMKEVSETLNPNVQQMNDIIKFIPLINVMESFYKLIEYGKVRYMFADNLKTLDCVEEMTEEEKKQYALKPTGFNAIKVSLKSSIKKSDKRKITIIFKEGEEEGKITFKILKIKDKNSILIINSEGIAKKMSISEQKQKIIENCELLLKNVNEKYGDLDSFKNELNNKGKIDLSNLKKNNHDGINECEGINSNKDRIKELKELKNELTETGENEENDYSYKKKK